MNWTGRLFYCPRCDRFCSFRSKDFLPTDCRYETCHPAGITVNILTFSKQREVFFNLVPSSFLDAVFTEFYDTRILTTASALSLSSATQYSLRPHPIPYCFIIFLVLSYFLRPGLQYGLVHSVLSTNATSPAHLMILGFITRITFGNQYNHEAPYYAVFANALLVSLPHVQIFSACFEDTVVCTEIINCLNTQNNLNCI
jgi:hypothetical protein